MLRGARGKAFSCASSPTGCGCYSNPGKLTSPSIAIMSRQYTPLTSRLLHLLALEGSHLFVLAGQFVAILP